MMHASVLIQQLKHLVCISIALASLSENYRRLSYLLFGQDKTIQQEKVEKHKKNEQTVYSTRHSSRQRSNDFTVDLRGQIARFAR